MIRRFLQAHQRDPCLHSSLHSSSQGAMNSTACHASSTGSQGSPIPYLLAGLAAMLALVAVSLFILACSYWKLVGCVDQYGVRTSASTATAAPQTNNMIGMDPNSRGVEEETTKIVVIMAGQDKPTFLAQPLNG